VAGAELIAKTMQAGSSDDELIWQFAQKQLDYSIQQFITSLIGLGALLFAYGEVKSPFVETTIAAVGLAASIVLWTHSYVARVETNTAEQEVSRTRPKLVNRLHRLQSWRYVTRWGVAYQSVTRLIIYFNALMALAWVTILLLGHGIPPHYLYSADFGGVAAVIVVSTWRRRQDRHGFEEKYLLGGRWKNQKQSTLIATDQPSTSPEYKPWPEGVLVGLCVIAAVGVGLLCNCFLFPHFHFFGS